MNTSTNCYHFPKKFLFLIACVGFLSFYASGVRGQMRKMYLDTGADNEIMKLSFYSPSEGYVAFSDWIGYTTDSGRTFTKKYITLGNVNFNGYGVNVTFGFVIAGVKGFDKNNLIAYGHYGLVPSILYSSDGGNSFTLVYHSQFNAFQLRTGITDMIFPENDNVGYACDADRILRTTDKGLTWAVVDVDPGRYFDHLEAPDDATVYAMSTDYQTNKLVRSLNSGASWQDVTLPSLPRGKLDYAYFLNASAGWLNMEADNYQYYLFKTSDGGITWNQLNDPEATPFLTSKFKFLDANTGYALGYQNTVFKTLNGGTTWEPLPRDNNYSY